MKSSVRFIPRSVEVSWLVAVFKCFLRADEWESQSFGHIDSTRPTLESISSFDTLLVW